jgi:hypothetical protein
MVRILFNKSNNNIKKIILHLNKSNSIGILTKSKNYSKIHLITY